MSLFTDDYGAGYTFQKTGQGAWDQRKETYADSNWVNKGYLDADAFKGVRDQYNQITQQVQQLEQFKGTSNFDAARYSDLKIQQAAANQRLIRNTLINTGGKGRNGEQQRILDMIKAGDVGFQGYLDSIGGEGAIDWNVFENGDGASKFLAGYDSYTQAQTDAQKNAADAQKAAADQKKAEDEALQAAQDQADKAQILEGSALGAYKATLDSFDADIQRQFGKLGADALASSRGVGFRDAGASASQLGAEKTLQAGADRDALSKDASGTLNETLSKIFADTESFAENQANLSVEQQLQVSQQASGKLIQQIDYAVQNGQLDASNETAELKNLLEQYRNEQTSAQQKRQLLSRIVRVGLGVLQVGAGAAIAAGTFGGGAPVGAGLIASGVGTAGSAA